ncbi:agmatine deiminase family protein [Microcella pacifica]|jgi:agmatine deiminase|uniref:Agmatine deiminase family protein n=1 Tax=Microcella pacifica TaxID=2591847 RepID=A0A9E5JSC4_9MICO|nr:agmatine deiminase family protein [Microcella pacifica]NHF63967.1 agmatine deiminase family protein [Microcella pacifica]
MTWRMPPETAPHDRIWMAFPREGEVMGDSSAAREATYAAWTAVAHAILPFEPVTMVVDPSERERARRLLSADIDVVEAPLDDFWMRDIGPTFVVDDETGELGGVDWVFNAWGDQGGAFARDALIAEFVLEQAGATRVPSLLVNEGGAIHVDGEGTVMVTETVQLDPGRNRYATKERVEAELTRTLGVTQTLWLQRGLTRDYEPLGTRGHVDMIATFASPGVVLVHEQPAESHPDHAVMREVRAVLSQAVDAQGRSLELIDLPAPAQLTNDEGFVDWNYVNHLTVNSGVIACGYDDPVADARARELLGAAYPGREVVTVDAREILARGGGIHCITQQQPSAPAR